MNEIRSLLALARRRMELSRFLAHLHAAGLVLAAVALALMLADRSTSAPFVPWAWVGPALGVLAAGVALTIWSRRRPTELHVALAVDERLSLREKLSTALHCAGRDDAFARAAVEDAVTVARDPRTAERARRTMAVASPRAWWISPVLVLAALAAAWLPQFNLFAARVNPADSQVQVVRQDAQQSVETLVQEIKKNDKLAESMTDLLGELSNDPLSADDLKSAADVKRDALKKVTELNERLEEILRSDDAAATSMLERSLRQMQAPGDGPAKDFAKSLSKGDFKAAQQALQQMMQQAQNGELSPQQMQQMADQLQQIGAQLNELAAQQQALEQALKQAGLDPQLAQNPAALQQAMQNNPNLNQQQQQQLQQMAQAQQQAQQQMQGMAQMCQQMAQGMQQGQQGQAGQAAQKMGQMLGDMEAMQQMMQMAKASSGSCKSKAAALGQNLASQAQNQGGAFGGPGVGSGGEAPKQRTPTGTKLEHDPGRDSGELDVIFRQFVEGDHVIGESKAKLRAVATAATEGLKQGVTEDQIPRKYHEAHQHYFGRLQKMAESAAGTPASTGSPAPKPSEPTSAPP